MVCMVRHIGKESIVQGVCVCKKHCLYLYGNLFIVNTAVLSLSLHRDSSLKPVNILLWNQLVLGDKIH